MLFGDIAGDELYRFGQLGQRYQRHGAPGAGCLVQQGVDTLDPGVPIAGIGPCGIQQHQQRAGSAPFGLRVQDRACEPDNHRRDGQHPQQQQPPRGAVGLCRLVRQPQQQRHAGKPPPDRRRRNRPQDDPQDRQGDQRQQEQRGGKAKGANHPHQACLSNAPNSHNSADAAGPPVWCV